MRLTTRILWSTAVAVFAAFASFAKAETDAAADDDWQNVQNFEARRAFEAYGPPTQENAKKSQEETQLYNDMVLSYDDIADDEDEFSFVSEAFSVPVESFRPASARINNQTEADDIFADDPLPDKTISSSGYVHDIRPSFLPGQLLKQQNFYAVKLGESGTKPLFAPTPPPPPPPKKAEARPEDAVNPFTPPPDESKKDDLAAGKINAPPKGSAPAAGTDEETLHALRQAVKDLGLEKKLNFESSPTRNTMAEGKPETPPAAAGNTGGVSSALPQASPLQKKQAATKAASKKSKISKAKKKAPKAVKKKKLEAPKPVAQPAPIETENDASEDSAQDAAQRASERPSGVSGEISDPSAEPQE
jgi:hypothetical protein